MISNTFFYISQFTSAELAIRPSAQIFGAHCGPWILGVSCGAKPSPVLATFIVMASQTWKRNNKIHGLLDSIAVSVFVVIFVDSDKY